MWEVEFTDEFGHWWGLLTEDEQESLTVSVKLLQVLGPALGRPHADAVKGSRHSNMKELRTQCHGEPLRTFYAFDPRRKAILLIGGSKSGDKQFYERMVPLADKILDEHLREIEKEVNS
ncbi:MAG: type II toxin-antitoxin system RelE/ParE family toxin [Deltaproteobacteria bacterium]|nr:type II toxin-antitoxin system RelE/ParE family toxin [Deltaproteobacteria bacterium]